MASKINFFECKVSPESDGRTRKSKFFDMIAFFEKYEIVGIFKTLKIELILHWIAINNSEMN